MNIHPVTHGSDKNRYCGPSALSILTGMTTGEAARLLRHITGRSQIQSTSTGSVLRAIRMCGLGYRPHYVPTETKIVTRKGDWFTRAGDYAHVSGELTLAQWLKKSVPTRTTGRVFLVVAGNHWQIITGRRYCCGRTEDIVSITDKKVKRRARVTEVYEILLHAGNKVTIPAAARRPKTTGSGPERQRLEAFLKTKGIPKGKLVKYDSTITDYVIPPCDVFRKGFSTIHYNWPETQQRLEYCFENPSVLIENDGHYSE